jgi:flavin reductase (DIM6/NTAB) family NADH-FMN oxidoreductase RutF
LAKKEKLTEWKNFKVLKEALAYVLLQERNKMDAGDHILFLYDVVGFYNNLEGEELTLNELRNKKLIRG